MRHKKIPPDPKTVQRMKKFLIVGSGGRESAFAEQLAKDVGVYAVMSHENPSIVHYVKTSGGSYAIGDASNPETVLDFARAHEVDYVFVSADEPLANGVVDMLLENNIKVIGGTREASRIEWDKVYSIEMVKKTCPKFTPFFIVVSDAVELRDAVDSFASQNLEMAVKPQGLTGGKGVKVMPEHLQSYQDCIDYAGSLLHDGQQVLLVEKLHGIEFTIMGITDGEKLVLAPASYDYPFRLEGDRGAGTGGMGCFTNSEKKLPFMTDDDLDDCRHIMQRIIDEIRSMGLKFNGVLNGGFFKTKHGIRFMEFNGRFGDPEGINVLSVLQGSFSELLIHIWDKTLSESGTRFIEKASVVKYLVTPSYPGPDTTPRPFSIDESEVSKSGVRVLYASCVKTGHNRFMTVKNSRVAAFGAVSDTIESASEAVNFAIDNYTTGDLEYRRDIGSKENLEKLVRF